MIKPGTGEYIAIRDGGGHRIETNGKDGTGAFIHADDRYGNETEIWLTREEAIVFLNTLSEAIDATTVEAPSKWEQELGNLR